MKSDLLLNQPVNDDLYQAHQNYVDIGALNDLKQQAREDQRAALKPVAEQFEALFLEQIFKESRKVKLDDGWLDGSQTDFYKDWHDKQLSQDISAKGSLGFADNIVEQLLPSIPSLDQSKQEKTQGSSEHGEVATLLDDEIQQKAASTQDVLSIRSMNDQ